MAPIVRRIFAMRGNGASQGEIADSSGVKYSTVIAILHSRVYLGEVLLNGEWYPGHHDPIITPAVFEAAHRGRIKGRRRGKDLLAGKVRRGLCLRLMAIDGNGEGRRMYRCHHRGEGCSQPRRTVEGLVRAAVLGLQLIGEDDQLQEAIRRELERHRAPAQRAVGAGAAGRSTQKEVEGLEVQRRKLLRLYYEDRVSSDLFAEEETRLVGLIQAARAETNSDQAEMAVADDVRQRFDEVSRVLAELDV